MPEEKFAPPPSNIVIRTMEKDIQALQQGGGDIPPPTPPEAPPPQTAPNAFLYQTPQPTPEPPIPTPPPPSGGGIAAPPPAPEMGVPEEKSMKPLLLALAGVAGLLALGAVGYFVVVPIVRNAFAPLPTVPPPLPTMPTLESPPPIAEASPSPSPSPTVTSPLPALIVPADQTVDLPITERTAEALSAALIEYSKSGQQQGAFHLVVPKTAEGYLDAATVFPLLFDRAPNAIVSALSGPYGIWIYWVNPQTPRLGAYFSLAPTASEAAAAALRDWEATLVQDSRRMFLGLEPGTVQGAFRDGQYQNVPLRFALLSSGLAIDHAVIANTFVFTTDKDSMFEAIRRLTGVK